MIRNVSLNFSRRMQLDFGFRANAAWMCRFCSAGVPPAVLRLDMSTTIAGETAALQNLALYNETCDHRSNHENRDEMSELGD